jgi:hypothetical protein
MQMSLVLEITRPVNDSLAKTTSKSDTQSTTNSKNICSVIRTHISLNSNKDGQTVIFMISTVYHQKRNTKYKRIFKLIVCIYKRCIVLS